MLRYFSLCVVIFSLSAFADSPPPAVVDHISKHAAKTLPSEDPLLTNFHTVVPGLVFRGGRPKSEKALSYLVEKYKIKTIINLQGADPEAFDFFEPGELKSARNLQKTWALASGIGSDNWINIPLDSWDKVSKEESHKINSILEIINDPNSQPVFVHCEHGKDRTGLVIALFQVFYQVPSVLPVTALKTMYLFGHNGLLKEMDEYFNLATALPMGLQKLDDVCNCE